MSEPHDHNNFHSRHITYVHSSVHTQIRGKPLSALLAVEAKKSIVHRQSERAAKKQQLADPTAPAFFLFTRVVYID